MLAFDRAGDPDWYPELGEPFQPSKLYYSTWSFEPHAGGPRGADRQERRRRRSTRSGSSGPNTDDRITTRIDVADFQWARSGALRAHATQVDPAEAWWFGLDDDELNAV